MTDNTEKFAESISSSLSNAPQLSDLDNDETATLRIKYTKSRRIEGVAVQFHFGTGTSETAESVTDAVEPMVDKRKFKLPDDNRHGRTWTIGTVEVDQNGTVVSHDIDDEYLKPTLQ